MRHIVKIVETTIREYEVSTEMLREFDPYHDWTYYRELPLDGDIQLADCWKIVNIRDIKED